MVSGTGTLFNEPNLTSLEEVVGFVSQTLGVRIVSFSCPLTKCCVYGLVYMQEQNVAHW